MQSIRREIIYEKKSTILIETELRTYMVHTTDYAEVGREVGLKFGPEDIHVMCKMGSY